MSSCTNPVSSVWLRWQCPSLGVRIPDKYQREGLLGRIHVTKFDVKIPVCLTNYQWIIAMPGFWFNYVELHCMFSSYIASETCKPSIQSPMKVPVSCENNEPSRLWSPSDKDNDNDSKDDIDDDDDHYDCDKDGANVRQIMIRQTPLTWPLFEFSFLLFVPICNMRRHEAWSQSRSEGWIAKSRGLEAPRLLFITV